MYGKIFASLYQGTLRGKAHEILVFTNMIACADQTGIVDKHPRAIAEEIGLDLESTKAAITSLEAPDPESRSLDNGGARIVKAFDGRAWGWQIVNYVKYRAIRSEEDRREQNRLAQERYRQRNKPPSACVSNSKPPSAESKQDKPKEREKEKHMEMHRERESASARHDGGGIVEIDPDSIEGTPPTVRQPEPVKPPTISLMDWKAYGHGKIVITANNREEWLAMWRRWKDIEDWTIAWETAYRRLDGEKIWPDRFGVILDELAKNIED